MKRTKLDTPNISRLRKLIIVPGKMPDGSETEAPAYYDYPRKIQSGDNDVAYAAWAQSEGTRYTSQEGIDNENAVKHTDVIEQDGSVGA